MDGLLTEMRDDLTTPENNTVLWMSTFTPIQYQVSTMIMSLGALQVQHQRKAGHVMADALAKGGSWLYL